MLDSIEILEKYWGHTSFRPLQQEIITASCAGKDVLVLLPTGGGKSVCFQVPALMKEGICLVVSPLIALMNDQVEALKKKGIAAVSLGGNLTFAELDRQLDHCVNGEVKFLYLSPERLQSELVTERIKRMKVNLLAVDEAHCISQWGHDFRPEYVKIKEVRKILPGVPVMALTASATERVLGDISTNLALVHPELFRKSFLRSNLSIFIKPTEQKAEYLFKVLNKNVGSGLVYVQSRKETKVLAELMQGRGESADYYHAGLTAHERQVRQQSWLEGRTRVMVCTNAFGMGIDKPDVRFVVHWGMPSSPEAYYQEAGRGGRDGHRAYAVGLVSQGDLDRLTAIVDESFPEKKTVKRVYSLLGSYYRYAYGAGLLIFNDFDLSDFSAYCKLPVKTVFHSLEILKYNGLLLLNEAVFQPARINMLMGHTKLYEFQVFNPKFEPLLKLLLRSYAGLFDDFVKIDEWMLARKLSWTVELVRQNLQMLHQLQVLEYYPTTEKPQLAFATERFHENNFRIHPEAYEDRKKAMEDQINGMISLIQTTECRFELICKYFDDQDTQACGHCDNCLKKLNEPILSQEEVIEEIKRQLTEAPKTGKELKECKSLRFHDEKVNEALQWLLGQEVVTLNADQRFVIGRRKTKDKKR